MKKIINLTAAFLFLILAAANLQANDTSGAVLPAGGVQFKKTDGIKMEVESLFVKPANERPAGGDALVEVNYIFENITDKDITVDVFFPLPDMAALEDGLGGGGSEFHDFNFELWVNNAQQRYNVNFQLFVNDINVSKYFKELYKNYYDNPAVEKVDEHIDKLQPEDKKYLQDKGIIERGHINDEDPKERWIVNYNMQRKVYFYWTQTFPANKKMHIRHTYFAPGTTMNVGGSFIDGIYKQIDEIHKQVDGIHKHTGDDYYLNFWGHFEYILKTANNWNRPIRNFNLLVEGPAGAAVSFEGAPHLSKDKFFAKNIVNFAPGADLQIEFAKADYVQYAFYQDFNEEETAAAKKKQDQYYKNIKYSNAKLYKIDGPANIRNNPDGKIIKSLKDGVYVWVVEEKGGWSRIVYNDLRGWTYKKNLIDIWNLPN